MLVFEEGGKPENPEKNLQGRGANQQQNDQLFGLNVNLEHEAGVLIAYKKPPSKVNGEKTKQYFNQDHCN